MPSRGIDCWKPLLYYVAKSKASFPARAHGVKVLAGKGLAGLIRTEQIGPTESIFN
jgi:hypothetical protein